MLIVLFFSFIFSFISLIADGPHHYHPACGHKGSSHLSPVHALHFFYRDASSALLQLVNQWLNFTYSRSHAFRYERKNTNTTLVRIELTTSVLADVQQLHNNNSSLLKKYTFFFYKLPSPLFSTPQTGNMSSLTMVKKRREHFI